MDERVDGEGDQEGQHSHQDASRVQPVSPVYDIQDCRGREGGRRWRGGGEEEEGSLVC